MKENRRKEMIVGAVVVVVVGGVASIAAVGYGVARVAEAGMRAFDTYANEDDSEFEDDEEDEEDEG